ncbi:MAG: SRPBCC domain-containing protein [Patescibacteria group bacterium]
MQTLHFSVHINAPVEKVWDTMLADATYRQWTAAFCPGSHYRGSWEQGSEIRFIGPNPDGSGNGGVVSCIRENRLHEFISVEHLGLIENDVEDTTSEKVKGWVGAHENYTFTAVDGGTDLQIDTDTEESFVAMFNDMWPKALHALKELAEK